MATVISDYASTTLPFQNMIAATEPSHQPQYHSSHRHSLSPRFRCTETSPGTGLVQLGWKKIDPADKKKKTPPASVVALGFPSPSSSSSDSFTDGNTPKDANSSKEMAPEVRNSEPSEPSSGHRDDSHAASCVGNSIPSPNSDGHRGSADSAVTPEASIPLHLPPPPPPPLPQNAENEAEASERQCTTIHVRDLKHIQELARAYDMGNGPGILNEPTLQSMKYEISAMPIHDIIEMVAALLTKITTTNDLQHDVSSRNASHHQHATSQNEGTRETSPFSGSVLAFHGKNVPAITILSYLARIHKYCPTTYEVFLSLLVYFDRMTERVNGMVMKSERQRQQRELEACMKQGSGKSTDIDVVMVEVNNEDLPDNDEVSTGGTSDAQPAADSSAPATYFVVDSFNIHRLIIAGVTCASKFFSDVFYTNSRYAKVGSHLVPA